MSAAVEHATLSHALPLGEGWGEVASSTDSARDSSLARALPGLGDNAIVRVDRARPRRDSASGDALALTVEGLTWWTLPFGAGERIVRLGTLPDLDGDRIAEVRAAYLSPRDAGVLTRMVSGRTGVALHDLGPEHRATVWPDADGGEFPSDWPDSMSLPVFLRRRDDSVPSTRLMVETLFGVYWLSEAPRSSTPRLGLPVHHGVDALLIAEKPGQQELGPSQLTVKLGKVEYSNSIPVRRDRHPQTYYPPVWYDKNQNGTADDWVQTAQTPFAGDIRAPICYLINQHITLNKVEIVLSKAYGLGQSLAGKVVRGRLPGSGLDGFVSTTLTYNGDGTVITATNFTTNAGDTMTTIGRIADYSIDWRIDVTGTLTSYAAGTSRNHIHWVLQGPGEFPFFYTSLDIGCRKADGLDGTNHSLVADAIYSEFMTRSIVPSTDTLEGLGNTPLAYYKIWQNSYGNEADLLRYGDGACGAWGLLFIRCMYAVGIEPPDPGIEITLPPTVMGATNVLLVPAWTSTGQSNANHPVWGDPYRYIGIPMIAFPPPWHFIGNNYYAWRMSDMQDVTGVPGQGPSVAPNPLSLFSSHSVVRVGSKYYDPSYGSQPNTSDEALDSIFSSFGIAWGLGQGPLLDVDEGDVQLDLDGNNVITPGNRVFTQAIIWRDNPAGVQIVITPVPVDR